MVSDIRRGNMDRSMQPFESRLKSRRAIYIAIVIGMSTLLSAVIPLTLHPQGRDTSLGTLPLSLPRLSAIQNRNQSTHNGTWCAYHDTFRMGRSGKRLTVCVYQGNLRVDFRQFIGTKATIKGIFFNYDEYRSLQTQLPIITESINRALNWTSQRL